MKMSGFLKGIAGLAVIGYSWVDANLSPLFWVLLVLIAVDLILNVKHGGQQWQKLLGAGAAMGIPGIIATNINVPHFAKLVVTLMCLVMLQVVVPQVMALIAALGAKKVIPQSEVPDIEALVQAEFAKLQQRVIAGLPPAAQAAVTNAEQTAPAVAPDFNSVGTGGQ